MARTIAVGIDVGTYQVRVVVAEIPSGTEHGNPKIIGTGLAESKGLRHGFILNAAEATRAIKAAIRQAEKVSGIEIKHCYLSVGGIGLTAITSQASVVITRSDSEITELDLTKVQETCERELPKSVMLNRKIITTVPLAYKLDGKQILGRPEGMKGMRLEVRMLFVTYLEQHLDDLVTAVGDAGVEVDDVMASPLAASLVTLTKAQKIAGVVLANIGAETVSIVVYENDIPISLEVFPLGSTDITHDIALAFRIPLDEAEKLKLGRLNDNSYSKKKLDDVTAARLDDMFELIEAHLKKIGRSELLPAGIVITGGGSSITSIEDIAKAALKLPSRLASFHPEGKPNVNVRDSSWSVAYGLCILGLTQKEESGLSLNFHKKIWETVVSWTKQFLP